MSKFGRDTTKSLGLSHILKYSWGLSEERKEPEGFTYDRGDGLLPEREGCSAYVQRWYSIVLEKPIWVGTEREARGIIGVPYAPKDPASIWRGRISLVSSKIADYVSWKLEKWSWSTPDRNFWENKYFREELDVKIVA